jgi:hypothetical protein
MASCHVSLGAIENPTTNHSYIADKEIPYFYEAEIELILSEIRPLDANVSHMNPRLILMSLPTIVGLPDDTSSLKITS